jgi:hypothetical protein
MISRSQNGCSFGPIGRLMMSRLNGVLDMESVEILVETGVMS